jgi:hypothetical protein
MLAAPDLELADFFDVTPQTILAWKASHKEFSEAIRLGQEVVDQRVERSLYQQACGYSRDAIRIIKTANGRIEVHYREYVPGDVRAQIKWLTNRQPDRWSEG